MVLRAIVLIAALIVPSLPGRAQGFLVRPMKVEFTPHPGQTVERDVELKNTQTDSTGHIELIPLDLGQTPDGQWIGGDPAKSDRSIQFPAGRSCRAWAHLNASTIDVPPLGSRKVALQIKIPTSARGFYAMALLARVQPPPPDPTKRVELRFTLQFLVPIIINIEGMPAREQIKLSDVGMNFIPALGKRQVATTVLTASIANRGESYGRITGTVAVLRQFGAQWRKIASVPLPEGGVLPSVTITKGADIERRLPSGQYKVQADLQVGGRPRGHIEKLLDFKGDPTASPVQADAQIELDPPTLLVDVLPGSIRAGTLKIHNLSDAVVQIAAAAVIPDGLKGVAMGTVLGDQYDGSSWVSLSPPQFTLGKGGTRNVRVTLRVPPTATDKPYYYVRLMVRAAYPDGQSAGSFSSLVIAHNPRSSAPAAPNAQPIQITLNRQEGGQYAANARFGNVGNTHYTPTAQVTLMDPIGAIVQRASMSTTSKEVLPLGTPEFSGALDFGKVKPGGYVLTSTMAYAGKQVSQTLPLRVTKKNGLPVVNVVDQTVAAPKPVKKPVRVSAAAKNAPPGHPSEARPRSRKRE